MALLRIKRGRYMRRPSLFKERDVRRAAKAVLAVGLEIDRIEIGKDGRIIVVPARLEEISNAGGEPNQWEDAA
jgi:hypothetical protein